MDFEINWSITTNSNYFENLSNFNNLYQELHELIALWSLNGQEEILEECASDVYSKILS